MKKRFSIFLILVFLICYIFSFSVIPSVDAIPVDSAIVKRVNPIGRVVGLKMYTNGVLVVGMSEVEDENGNRAKPYEGTGIKEGDMIKSINGRELKNVEDLVNEVNNSKGKDISIRYERNGDEIYTTLAPIKSADGSYMLGLWVRDAAAGIGTITFYDSENSSFAALGHGIEDVDTSKLLTISNGEIVTGKIISIVKGQSNKPGEIRATIDEGVKVGEIEKNTDIGVYGKATNYEYINSVKLEEVPVAARNQIHIGKATIICQLTNEGVEEFEIEIKKIFRNNSKNNKSMMIKVTDEKLINKTGGIIPGMSGTPVIQDGKFVGAITNVLLNDPTQGYAIFADMMF